MLRQAWREIEYCLDVGRAANEDHMSFPQGSINSSTLVLIFINDLVDGISALHIIYSNDTTI